MTEVPADLTIETIWVIEATYGPNARELRPTYRPEHLARMARLRDEGIVLEVGGFLDFSSALVLARVPDEQAALALAREDVYTKNGVWTELRARPLGRLARKSELERH